MKYNRFHDQLLLSGSSDCMVHLWRVSSVSSAPLLEPEDDDIDGLEANVNGDGVGFAGGINGSKGEAADIRVSYPLLLHRGNISCGCSGELIFFRGMCNAF